MRAYLGRWERFLREQRRVMDGWIAAGAGLALSRAWYGGFRGRYVEPATCELTGGCQFQPNVVAELLVILPAAYGAYRILSNLEYRVQHPNADADVNPAVSVSVRVAVAILVGLLLG